MVKNPYIHLQLVAMFQPVIMYKTILTISRSSIRRYFSHQQVQETSVYTQINISVRHKNRIKSLKFQHLLLVRSTRQSMAARRTSSK